MAIQFNCPYCTSAIRVADAAAGRIGKCPKCGTKLRVPRPEVPPAPAPAVPPEALPAAPAAAPASAREETPFPDWSADPAFPPLYAAPLVPAVEPVPPPLPGWDGNPFANFDVPAAVDPIEPAPSLLARRRQQPSLWVKVAVPLLFVAILLGIGGAYWWSQRPTMTGELPGERLPADTVLTAPIPRTLVDAPGDAYDAAVAGLIETPQTISTDLMFVEIAGGPEGLHVRLQAGAETELVRVDVRRNPLLAKVAQEQADKLDADRRREFHDASREFAEAWRDSASSGMLFGNTAAYRDKLGINALLRGVGYHSTAIVGNKAYPCVHEDDKGRLDFLVPRGTAAFVIAERPHEGRPSVFPSEYRFNVSVAPAAPAAAAEAVPEVSDPAAPDEDRSMPESTEMPTPAAEAATPPGRQ